MGVNFCALLLIHLEGGDFLPGWREYLQCGCCEGGVALVARFTSLEGGTDRADAVDFLPFSEGSLAVRA